MCQKCDASEMRCDGVNVSCCKDCIVAPAAFFGEEMEGSFSIGFASYCMRYMSCSYHDSWFLTR